MKRSIIFGIVALLSVAPAMAGKRTIELVSPPEASQQRAWGMAATGDAGRVQTFQVRADVAMRDGTQLVVAIEREDRDGGRDWYNIGIVRVRLGTAFMALDNREDFSPAFPVESILGVEVRYRGRGILRGTFETRVD